MNLFRVLTIIFFGFALFVSTAVAQSRAAASDETEQLLRQLTQAVEANDLTVASPLLQRALTVAPRNHSVLTLAGIVADRENDLSKAERYFSLAAKLAPDSAQTRNNYGAILLRINKQAAAAKEFAASLTINPKQVSALANLGQIRLAENNSKAARELFERAKAIAPDKQILRALVAVSLNLNEKERAAAEFKEYSAAHKGNSESNASTSDAPTEIAFGKSLFAAQMFAEARQVLEPIAAASGSEVEATVLLARVYLAQKQVAQAGKLLESAVANGVVSAPIYAALADVYQSVGRMENAIPAMKLAAETEPANDVYAARYGLLLIDARAPAAAIIRLSEAAKRLPGSARLRLALGIAQQINGSGAEARASFEKSLALEPASIPALAYLGTIYDEQANYAEAVKVYRQSLAIEPKNGLLHYLLADALLKIPATAEAEAETHLRQAVALDPKLASAHFALGKIHARRNAWQIAAQEFGLAVEFAPDFAQAHYQLGRALARLKRLDESKAAFDVYKKLNDSQSAQKEITRQDLVRRLADVRF